MRSDGLGNSATIGRLGWVRIARGRVSTDGAVAGVGVEAGNKAADALCDRGRKPVKYSRTEMLATANFAISASSIRRSAGSAPDQPLHASAHPLADYV
jgi:hypothetical protein